MAEGGIRSRLTSVPETKAVLSVGLCSREDHSACDYWDVYHCADNRCNNASYAPVSCAPPGFICRPFQLDTFIREWKGEKSSNPPADGENKPTKEQPPMDWHIVPADMPALLPAKFLVLVFQRIVPFGRRR